MTLQSSYAWRTYKTYLRTVINHHISQALGDLTPEEREHTKERVKQVTKRLDTYISTYMMLANVAQGEGNEQKPKVVDENGRAPSRPTGKDKE